MVDTYRGCEGHLCGTRKGSSKNARGRWVISRIPMLRLSDMSGCFGGWRWCRTDVEHRDGRRVEERPSASIAAPSASRRRPGPSGRREAAPFTEIRAPIYLVFKSGHGMNENSANQSALPPENMSLESSRVPLSHPIFGSNCKPCPWKWQNPARSVNIRRFIFNWWVWESAVVTWRRVSSLRQLYARHPPPHHHRPPPRPLILLLTESDLSK